MNKGMQYKKTKQLDQKNLDSDKWDHDGYDLQINEQYTSSQYKGQGKYKNQNARTDQNKKKKNYNNNNNYQNQENNKYDQYQQQKVDQSLIKKPDRVFYQPPNRGQIKNTSMSSNSDIKNIENCFNEEKLSNISLNLIDKDQGSILESIIQKNKQDTSIDSKNDMKIIENNNYLMDCFLHFPDEIEHFQIQSFNDYDSLMEKICQKHSLDILMSLSIKIMVLKQYLEIKPQEKNNLAFLSDGYFERFHKLINQDILKNINSSSQNNFCIDVIQNV